MPGFIKTKEDERLWQKAKDQAEKQGRKEDWAYITGIFKKMKGGKVAAETLTEEGRKKVIDLLASGKGKPIDDKKIHDLADELGLSPHILESEIYAYASMWAMNEVAKVNPGGRAEKKGVTSKDFPRATIEKGIKVEMEHTQDRELSEKIVLDHLAESPDYYDALEKMESGLEVGKKAGELVRRGRSKEAFNLILEQEEKPSFNAKAAFEAILRR